MLTDFKICHQHGVPILELPQATLRKLVNDPRELTLAQVFAFSTGNSVVLDLLGATLRGADIAFLELSQRVLKNRRQVSLTLTGITEQSLESMRLRGVADLFSIAPDVPLAVQSAKLKHVWEP